MALPSVGDDVCVSPSSVGPNGALGPNTNLFKPCIQPCLVSSQVSQYFPVLKTKFKLALSWGFGFWQLNES